MDRQSRANAAAWFDDIAWLMGDSFGIGDTPTPPGPARTDRRMLKADEHR